MRSSLLRMFRGGIFRWNYGLFGFYEPSLIVSTYHLHIHRKSAVLWIFTFGLLNHCVRLRCTHGSFCWPFQKKKKKIQLNGSYFCLQEWADSNGRLDERAKRLVLHGGSQFSTHSYTPEISITHLPLTGSHPQPFNHSCYQRGTKSLVCNQPRAHLFAEGITDCSPVLHPIWSFRLKCHK